MNKKLLTLSAVALAGFAFSNAHSVSADAFVSNGGDMGAYDNSGWDNIGNQGPQAPNETPKPEPEPEPEADTPRKQELTPSGAEGKAEEDAHADAWEKAAKEDADKKAKAEADKKEEERLSQTFKPENATDRVKKENMTDDPAKNEIIWADQAEKLYRANRIEDLAKYINEKMAASQEYKKQLEKYREALAREDVWYAESIKQLVLDEIKKEFPNADTYSKEDFWSDLLELTAAANTENKRGDVPEVDKYGKTDESTRGEEGLKPEGEKPEGEKPGKDPKEEGLAKPSEKPMVKPGEKPMAKPMGTNQGSKATASKGQTLPQTGEVAIFGAAAMAVLSGLGLAVPGFKKED